MSLAETLSWPFFEEQHRRFADELARWADATLPGLPHDDVDAACRARVAALGKAGFLKAVEPFSRRWSLASSVKLMVKPCVLSFSLTRASISSKIFFMSSFDRAWKKITSSMRFRNSGLNARFTSSMTVSFMDWKSRLASSSTRNPRDLPLEINRAPTLEVIMITVFLKFTLWPKLSVN